MTRPAVFVAAAACVLVVLEPLLDVVVVAFAVVVALAEVLVVVAFAVVEGATRVDEDDDFF